MTRGLDTSFLVAMEVRCHPDHARARSLAGALVGGGDRFAICPQVLAEFIHIVTDARRLTSPLMMAQALERARAWWDAPDVERVCPDETTVRWFLEAMHKHQLGRKRVLDTLMVSTFRNANITSVLTLNAGDFTLFGEFSCLPASS